MKEVDPDDVLTTSMRYVVQTFVHDVRRLDRAAIHRPFWRLIISRDFPRLEARCDALMARSKKAVASGMLLNPRLAALATAAKDCCERLLGLIRRLRARASGGPFDAERHRQEVADYESALAHLAKLLAAKARPSRS